MGGQDVASTGWAGITVRVAWTLTLAGVRVRPQVLRDARDHVLFHVAADLPAEQAEDRAEWLTWGFVARARRQLVNDPWGSDRALPLMAAWRRAVLHALDALSEAVWVHHYGELRTLEQIEQISGLDRITLEGARAGLREVARQALAQQGLPTEEWPGDRLDALLRRLFSFSPHVCPPVIEVLDGLHPNHRRRCARCDRACRLVAAQRLNPEDLIAPSGDVRPHGHVDVVALHFHPTARGRRATLARELPFVTFPVGDDGLLFDAGDLGRATPVLRMAAEIGAPSRDEVRGARVRAEGRWSQHGLLGPAADLAITEARARTWGEVDGLGELPAPLPHAPSARTWWAVAAALFLLAVGSLREEFAPRDHVTTYPLEVEMVSGRGGYWAQFDVGDAAPVLVVRSVGGRVEPVLRAADAGEKMAFAIGDGRFRVHVQGDGLLVASLAAPPLDLDALLAEANAAEDPMSALERLIRERYPTAQVERAPGQRGLFASLRS